MSKAKVLPIVTKPGRVPIKSWAGELDPRTLEQATNVSNLPFAIDHVALMPDGHAGYGMPIGGVLFADKTVVPDVIGVPNWSPTQSPDRCAAALREATSTHSDRRTND